MLRAAHPLAEYPVVANPRRPGRGCMLSSYVKAAMGRASYERLAHDGTWFGRIPGLEGVWGNAAT
jgi:hypothetical protein